MPSIKSHTLAPFLDLREILGDADLVGMSTGPRSELVVLAVIGKPEYRETRADGCSFAKLSTEKPHDFRVVSVATNTTRRVDIVGETWNYHFAQFLDAEEVLLVCARCRRSTDGTYNSNARVFNSAGQLLREFLLGDGIEEVQASSAGSIWVGYFDEGVFGDSVGACGLTCWNSAGNCLYEYNGRPSIDDCYALNVVSNEVTWLYYYSEFPLVRLRKQKELTLWRTPIQGADGFAICKGHVLFRGGYEARDTYSLYALQENGVMALRSRLTLKDPDRGKLKGTTVACRGSIMYVLHGMLCYRLDMSELIE